jgi:proteasome assembly chaperone (PAC2) family protein
MGNVAISAGYYLMAKLGMHLLAEFRATELFDVEQVEVKEGLVQPGRLPRSRIFVWNDPAGRHDILVFIGEAQPPMGKYAFCRRLIDFAREFGVERVFTFAAMATQMRPKEASRVYGAATDKESLKELKGAGLEIMPEGHIGGLNGVLLGVAAESGLRGACLLGEMPAVFAQLPFPKASLAVLQTFTKIAGIELDVAELREQAQAMEQTLDELLANVERAIREQESEGEETFGPEAPDEDRLDPEDERRIEQLFEQARENRSKAYELKRELDRLDVFGDYEDRFLDLFKKRE